MHEVPYLVPVWKNAREIPQSLKMSNIERKFSCLFFYNTPLLTQAYNNHLPDWEAKIARLALLAQQPPAPPAQYAHDNVHLKELNLIRVSYWHEIKDIMFTLTSTSILASLFTTPLVPVLVTFVQFMEQFILRYHNLFFSCYT